LLAFIDDGVGMSEEVLALAVDPFSTTKAPAAGSGLGLASVYGIVTALEGTLELESSPGEGTSVLIYLPVAHMSELQPCVTNTGDAQFLSTRNDPDPLSLPMADHANNQEITR